MSEIAALVTDHLDLWTAAAERKNGAGRGAGTRPRLYGIERLRELVLDLAVRGRLVPQNAAEGTGSELLETIQHTRRASGLRDWVDKVRGDATDLLPCRDRLPKSWAVAHLGQLTTLITDGTHFTPTYQPTGVAFISVKDIDGRTVSFSDCKFIDEDEHKQINARCNPEKGDILLCRIGTLGRATIVDTDRPFSLFVSVGLIKFVPICYFPKYYHLVLSSPMLAQQFDAIKAGGSHTNKLNLRDIPRLQIPLPPLAEQQRIVAKVEELMMLCDALEGESSAALAAHQTLVETLLATLSNSADAADLAANWTRLETHFDVVFTTEASVNALRRTILELAVRGRLVANSGEVKPGTLDDVGDWVGGNGFPKQFQGNQEGEFAFLKVSDMNLRGNERQITVSNNWVSADALRAMRARAHPVGTIIFPKIGGAIATNKRRILAVPAAIDNNCAGQIPRKDIDVDWLFMVLSSIDMATYQAGTSVPALNMKRLGKHPVAIPSTQMQREIVDRVDALMEICDELNARIIDAGQTQMRLADAIIEFAVG